MCALVYTCLPIVYCMLNNCVSPACPLCTGVHLPIVHCMLKKLWITCLPIGHIKCHRSTHNCPECTGVHLIAHCALLYAMLTSQK